MLRTYALAPQVLNRMLRWTFWRFQIITTVSFLVFGVYLTTFNRPIQWSVALPITALIALAYFLVIFFNYRQQMRMLYSMRIELDNSSISYRQLGQDPVRVMRADVVAACEQKNGLLVETVDPRVALFIPNGLANDGDQDVRATLDAWVGIEKRVKGELTEGWLLLVGLGGSIIILLFANTLWVIIPLGVVLIGYGMFTERRLAHQPGSSPAQMRSYNMAFSFLLFLILMKSCMIGLLTFFAR